MRKLTVLGAVAVVAVLVATFGLGQGQPASAALTTNDVTGGVLTVTSDAAKDSIKITCSGGNVKINGADPATPGGTILCSSITSIDVDGGAGAGADIIDLSSVNAAAFPALTATTLDGDGGNDIITGSYADDVMNGGDGNDTLKGKGGDDTLSGGPKNDTLNGGSGADTLNGGPGNDKLVGGGGGGDICNGNAGKDTATGSCETANP